MSLAVLGTAIQYKVDAGSFTNHGGTRNHIIVSMADRVPSIPPSQTSND